MKINLQNRQKVLTIGAALVVGLLIADSLIIEPLIKSWKDREAQIKVLTQKIGDGKKLLKLEASIRSLWSNMRSNALPNNFSEANRMVLGSVNRWVERSGIILNANNPSPPVQPRSATDEDYMTLECRSDVNGGMMNVARFIFELERDPLAIKIEDIDLLTKDDKGQQLSLGVRFTGLLFTSEQK